MTQNSPPVNTVAPLATVGMLMTTMTRALATPLKERFVVLHGHAGYGKTTAARYAANKFRAYRVECCSHWTRKALLAAILHEMGIQAGHAISDMFNKVVEQLARSGRPLIIDEADYLTRNSCIETVRDILDKSYAVVVLCGEEYLPSKLEKWERVHSRIFDYVEALPVDMDDVKHLAHLYCPDTKIDDGWLAELHQQTGGNTRRVCINLVRARNEAEHLDVVSLETWGDRGWYTGKSPKARKAV
jgi:DNA transposition AAA+ family ATPase